MLTKQELIERCDTFWDRYNLAAGMAGQEFLFADIMHIALEYVDYKVIAQYFEAIPSSVQRYGKGIVRPHPRMQKQIIEYVAKLLREEL